MTAGAKRRAKWNALTEEQGKLLLAFDDLGGRVTEIRDGLEAAAMDGADTNPVWLIIRATEALLRQHRKLRKRLLGKPCCHTSTVEPDPSVGNLPNCHEPDCPALARALEAVINTLHDAESVHRGRMFATLVDRVLKSPEKLGASERAALAAIDAVYAEHGAPTTDAPEVLQ